MREPLSRAVSRPHRPRPGGSLMPVEHDTQTYIDAEPNSGGNEPYGSPANAEQWYEEDTTPRRPRRRLLSPVPLALFGVILAGCGFILGVHAEKGSGSAASAGAGGFPSRSSTSGAASTAGKTSGPSGPPGSSGSTGSSKATSGTLAFLSGSTLYVTNSSGNTVKVLTSSTTSVSKTVKVKASAIPSRRTADDLGGHRHRRRSHGAVDHGRLALERPVRAHHLLRKHLQNDRPDRNRAVRRGLGRP